MSLVILCGVCYSIFAGVLMRTTHRRFSVDRIVVLCMAVFYGIIFPTVYCAYSVGFVDGMLAEIIAGMDTIIIFEYYACAVLLLIGTIGVFSANKKEVLHIVLQERKTTPVDNNHIEWINWIFLLIGITCSYLYYRVYGGFENYLNYSARVRMGIFEIYNPFSFLIIFRNFTVLSAYLAFARVFSNERVKYRDVVLLVISIIYAIMTLYSNLGRVSFVFFFLIMMLYFVVRKQKNEYSSERIGARIGFVLVIAVVGLFVSGEILGRNDESSIIKELIGEVSFPFYDFITVSQHIGNGNYRYFTDLLIWPVFVLPTSIWSNRLGVQTASTLMTILTTGSRKGENGVTGELPIDLLSNVYLQLGFVGAILAAAGWCFWGCKMLRWVEKNIQNESTKRMLKVYILVEYFLRSLLYGDPYHIVQRMFPFIAFMIMFTVWKRVVRSPIEIRIKR